MQTVSFTYVLRKLLPYIRQLPFSHKCALAACLILLGIEITLSVYVPLIFKSLVSTFSQTQTSVFAASIIFLLASYGVAWTIQKSMKPLQRIITFAPLQRIISLFCADTFDHLLSLSLRFHVDRKTGAITTAIERTFKAIPNILSGVLFYTLPTLLEVCVAICFVGYLYGLWYGCLLFGVFATFVAVSFFGSTLSTEATNTYYAAKSRINARLVDTLLNYETVKYFNNETYESANSRAMLAHLELSYVQRYGRLEWIQVAQAAVAGLGIATMTLVSGYDVYRGLLNVSDFVLINTFLLQFVTPLSFFGYIFVDMYRFLGDMQEVFAVREETSEIVDAPQAATLDVSQATVEFHDVTFAYANERPILKNVSFSIPQGTSVALVGPSGSGKSTCARLLFRLYEPTSGYISINGTPINAVTQDSLRRSIGVVPQDTVLFNETLRYNIAYGKPDADELALRHAVRMAHLESFIRKLPQGLDTPVGERGLKISGGEKQRVAIARVVLKRPSIYIFDEATSALDTDTEREIQKNLEEISKGVTTLIIAHRLSTVVHANTIIVLDNGAIAEQGSHEELLKRKGLYYRMWEQQKHESCDIFTE